MRMASASLIKGWLQAAAEATKEEGGGDGIKGDWYRLGAAHVLIKMKSDFVSPISFSVVVVVFLGGEAQAAKETLRFFEFNLEGETPPKKTMRDTKKWKK